MTAMMLIGIEEKLGSQSLGVCLRILAEGGLWEVQASTRYSHVWHHDLRNIHACGAASPCDVHASGAMNPCDVHGSGAANPCDIHASGCSRVAPLRTGK